MPASIAPVKRGGFSACPARSTLEARISTQTISKAVNMTDANSILNCWKFEVFFSTGEHKSSAFSQMGEKAFYCSVCMVQCNSQVSSLRIDDSITNTIETCPSLLQDTYDTHLKNPSHKSSVSAAAAPSLQSMMSAIRADPTSVHFCQVCQVQCSGQQSYDQHVVGKKHLNKAGGGGGDGHKPPPQQPPVTSNFHCQICGIYTTDQNGLNMHFEGKNHKKKAARQQH